ncbi:hypothetical protein Lepto7376_3711 [[Leptolyngbya] sp. PCC 7376]|uniref:hypothetical protein n=1 Tax=[Leptolyngbya] sp. PCC 7376 TaxID=111781 RepID=UPI00029EFFCE|nr:hypothetical protein [[Leptolyngbya] sp. PCC 7376]AFY39887.1 hypothetical protein Lepto7376_3711 [[Leptolyngbya] sp. PCC 7376]
MSLTFFDNAVAAGGGNGVPAGLFLPIAVLPGVVAGEFGAGESQATKEGKALLAMSNALFDYYTANSTNLVGLLATRAKASASDVLDNITFTFQHQYVSKLSDASFGQIPLPAAGANSGVGGFAVQDIFAAAADVAAEGAISGEGVVIPYADLSAFGGSAPAGITAGNDNRDLIAAMNRAMADLVVVRDATNASAVTAATQANSISFTLAAAATATTDPTTGLVAGELDKISTVQMSTSYTVQVALNQSAQTFDVNVVTA